jgi:hypothetical protein
MTGALLHLLPVAIIHFRLKAIKDTPVHEFSQVRAGFISRSLKLHHSVFSAYLLFYTRRFSRNSGICSGFRVPCLFLFQAFNKLKEVIFYNTKCRKEKKLAETIGDLRLNIIDKLQPVLTEAEEKLK